MGVSLDRRGTQSRRTLLDPTFGPIAVTIVVITLIAVIGWRIRSRRTNADHRRILHDLPDITDLLVAALRAGLTPVQALRAITPLAPASVRSEFDAVIARLDGGDRFVEALRDVHHARALFDVLADGDRLGVPIEHLTFRLAVEAREQRRRSAESDARRLPVRLAIPLVACTLPSFVSLVIVPVLIDALSHLTTVE
jgi:tight adherence protein C